MGKCALLIAAFTVAWLAFWVVLFQWVAMGLPALLLTLWIIALVVSIVLFFLAWTRCP